MKKSIILSTVCALLAVSTIGCGVFKRQSARPSNQLTTGTYDHGIKGNVVYTGKETNKVEVDLRTQGFGPAPQLQIPAPPAGSSSQPQQNIGPYSNPPFPQYQPPQSQLDLKRGMNAYRADPSSPIGASQLPPKPVANSETWVNVGWTGGAYYNYNESKGSDVNATLINGKLAASSTRTWHDTETETQNPPPNGYIAYGGLVPAYAGYYGGGWQKQDNYYGGGGSSYYNPTQLSAPRGNSSNFYQTRSSSHGGHHGGGHHSGKSSNYY